MSQWACGKIKVREDVCGCMGQPSPRQFDRGCEQVILNSGRADLSTLESAGC